MSDLDPYRPPNPYSPPEASLAPDGPVPVSFRGLEPFSPAAVWRRAYEIYKVRTWLVFGLAFLPAVVNFVYNMVTTDLLERRNPGPANLPDLLPGVVALLGGLLQLWMVAGQTVGLVRVARGQPASMGDLFSGGRFFLPLVWGTIVYALGAMAASAACLLPAVAAFAAFGQGLTAIGVFLGCCLLAIAALIYYVVRLFVYQYVLVDQGLGGFSSLAVAGRLTAGRAIDVFSVFLRATLLNLVGLLACGLGLLYTAPLSALMLAVTYVLLVGEGSFGDKAEVQYEL